MSTTRGVDSSRNSPVPTTRKTSPVGSDITTPNQGEGHSEFHLDSFALSCLDEGDVEKGDHLKSEESDDDDKPNNSSGSNQKEVSSRGDGSDLDDNTHTDVDASSSSDSDDDPEAYNIKKSENRKGCCWKTISFFLFTVHSMGVVFGDLGTSPLYTYGTLFGAYPSFTDDDVLAGTCMITYSLIAVVCVKYVIIMMSVDRHGEGGILALVSLLPPDKEEQQKSRKTYSKTVITIKRIGIFLALMGAAFILGDGVITPAISVLSGIEGFGIQAPSLLEGEIPMGMFVIFLLFCVQRFGTGKIGFFFGPIMLLYFLSIGAIGIYRINQTPTILNAWNPKYIYYFFNNSGIASWTYLGYVVLALTGVEALYADMGHFGKWPIRLAWTAVIFPCCLLNYYGQGAILIYNPAWVDNPFFRAIPDPVFWPMFILANVAVVIASQSLITATFSLLYQAASFDFFPPLHVVHTSSSVKGQVYISVANWIMMVVCLGLVLFFKTASGLATAFGVAVTGTFACTTIVFMLVAYLRKRIPLILVIPVGLLFLFIDLAFFTGNLIKFTSGGWLPLLLALILLVIMVCWKYSSWILYKEHKRTANKRSLDKLISMVDLPEAPRHPGIGVFINNNEGAVVPDSLLSYRQICQSLPRTIVILAIEIQDKPFVPKRERVAVKDLGNNVYSLTLTYGFKSKRLNIDTLLADLQHTHEIVADTEDKHGTRVTYYAQRNILAPKYSRRKWTEWRHDIFNFCSLVSTNRAAVSIKMDNTALIDIIVKKEEPAKVWPRWLAFFNK